MDETAPQPLIERNKISGLIEDSYCEAVCGSVNILKKYHGSPGAVISLFDSFFGSFATLVSTTCAMPQLKQHQDVVAKAQTWTREKVDLGKQQEMFNFLMRGTEIFDEYKAILQETGVIHPTDRGM